MPRKGYVRPFTCTDCGRDLVCFEAGYPLGTRKCLGTPIAYDQHGPRYDADGGCGSLFSVEVDRDGRTAYVHRLRLY